MTKEQFITFKEDLKKAIEIVKLENKYSRKVWYNYGFKTKDDFDKAVENCNKQIKELKDSIICRLNERRYDYDQRKYVNTGNTYPGIIAEDSSIHEAYYIAKHRLSEDEAIEYVTKCIKNYRLYREWDEKYVVDFAKRCYNNTIKSVLAKYEEIVCNN